MPREENDEVLRGIDAVAEALGVEDFPMDKQGLAYSVGDIEVEDRRGRFVPVRVVLDAIQRTVFASADEAVRAIRAALDKAAERGR